jgi:hypothetical protein
VYSHVAVPPPSHLLVGQLTLTSGVFSAGMGLCSGVEDLSDVKSGSIITLTDSADTVLSQTQFSWSIHDQSNDSCFYEFGFKDVPEVDNYLMLLGENIVIDFTLEELRDLDWTVEVAERP